MIVLAHGLEGRPDGTKATALRDAGFDVIAPDGRNLALAARIAGVEAALQGLNDVILVGSSYGGVVAAVVANRHRERLRGLVLLAPALVWKEDPVDDPEAVTIPADLPCIVIHGVHDDIIPVDVSRRLARRSPHVILRERADDHLLRNSLPEMIAAVRELGG